MAYADTMRVSTATLEIIAGLIEGIFSSGFPATWTAWAPTYGASGAMTYTTVTTTTARYIRIGKLVFFVIDANGTTGGTANTTLTFTLPVTAASQNHVMGGQIFQASGKAAYAVIAGSTGSVSLYDSSNLSLSAGTYIRVAGVYEAA